MKYVFSDRRGAASIWGLVNHIASALVAEGNEVTYCRLNDGRDIQEPMPPDGVQLIDIDVPSKSHLWDLYRQANAFVSEFRPLLHKLRPDVVHTHFCVPGVVARHVARKEGVPVVVSTQHEMYGSMFPHYRWAVRYAERCTDAVVYVSETVADSFQRNALSVDASVDEYPHHVVIHNGIDLTRIDTLRVTAPAREPLKIVCSGRMVEGKGHVTLIEAMLTVVRCFPAAQLVLVGAGPQEIALRELVRERGLEPNVEFAGWLSHEATLREMANSAVVVAPSTGEGFGLVVAEAMACNTPVIASDIGAFREIAGQDAESMHFFKAEDRASLADRICQVLSDPEESSRRAVLARERVETCFSVVRMVREYLRLYDRVASRQQEACCV